MVLIWALKGHGITLRSEWDVAQYIERGELVRVLPQWYQEANIWAVYTRRSSSSDRIKICIDFLTGILHNACRAVKHRAYCDQSAPTVVAPDALTYVYC